MILTMRRSDRRDRRLCRFGVMLVVVSLVINMVAVPKAKAVVIDATAAFGAAAATAAINGTTATTLFTGMGTTAATSSVIGLMDTYAVTSGVAASGTALASTIGAGTVITAAGSLVLGAAAAIALIKFVEWLREENDLEAGGEDIYLGDVTGKSYFNGHLLPDFSSTTSAYNLIYRGSTGVYYFARSNTAFTVTSSNKLYNSSKYDVFYAYPTSSSWTSHRSSEATTLAAVSELIWTDHDISNYMSASSPIPQTDFDLSPNEEIQELPDAIPDGQTMVISPGITALPQNDPQAAADAIMQTAIDGNLSPTVTIEADPTVTPDPDPEPDPDPDGSTETDPEIVPTLPSNLGDLGNALTTRFPFSIPWDIAKAVKLLAAPAKAPYWQIDFMEPIKYRFEDIGDTTITLDFGKPEFEIIGITTRWTSTIGFCLALAAATKRFVWTA